MVGVLEPVKRLRPSAAGFNFQLPAHLEAGQPPEARGLSRDQVRLMVSNFRTNRVHHAIFQEISQFLEPGDLLIVNDRMNAALKAMRADGTLLELRLSTRLPANLWSVELRSPSPQGTDPFYSAKPGEILTMPNGGMVTLHTPHNPHQRSGGSEKIRLWIATLHLPEPLGDYLLRHSFPIRYKYVKERWPPSYYQTIFAAEKGSAEMPSAGRAFTPEIVTNLALKGVRILPLTLHIL